MNTTVTLSEVMFRTWEKFEYIQCARCGCLQITEIPSDLSRHYPASYYSLVPPSESSVIRHARSAAIRHHSGNYSLVGWMLSLVWLVPSDAHLFAFNQ